jgi:hypothetical protein
VSLADPADVENMYFKDVFGRWRSKRSSSQVENINRYYNALWDGPNHSPALVQEITCDFMKDKTIAASCAAGLMKDYGVTDLELLKDINQNFRALNLKEPFDNIGYPREPPILELNGHYQPETFGFNWLPSVLVDAASADSELCASAELPEVHQPEVITDGE